MAEIAYLQLTRLCNQECRFCSNPENGRRIPVRRAKAWIDRFARKGYAGVILTGGEPTLHPDLARLIRHAQTRGIPPRIITNAQRTAEPGLLEGLRSAGLRHMHVSVYSCRPKVQGFLTGKKDSLANIAKTLDEAGRLKLRVDINTVINKYNADHLDALVRWVIGGWPFVRHFVWNNLDPTMNRATKNPDTIPRLRDFELSLFRAMSAVHASGRTFRVERVPLCYMTDFAHCSTETRKLVKSEGRAIYFLDEKGIKVQNTRGFWSYGKAPRCRACALETVCAGLYEMDRYYKSDELCPVFVSKERLARRILGTP
jgi:MoaA/NifB/PqqE/SkfB family radical SAM enzyme